MTKITVALLAVLAVACQNNGSRRVSGTLSAAHPSDTSILAIGGRHRASTAVALDGNFSLDLPAGAIYRLHVITHRAGHASVLGTVTSHGRAIRIHARSSTSPLLLGRIGSPEQQLTPGEESEDCTGPGQSLETEHDADEGPDAGEREGNNNEFDAGDEHDSHDDVCENGEHDDAGDKDDGGANESDGGD